VRELKMIPGRLGITIWYRMKKTATVKVKNQNKYKNPDLDV
jgi:hypothetical protein